MLLLPTGPRVMVVGLRVVGVLAPLRPHMLLRVVMSPVVTTSLMHLGVLRTILRLRLLLLLLVAVTPGKDQLCDRVRVRNSLRRLVLRLCLCLHVQGSGRRRRMSRRRSHRQKNQRWCLSLLCGHMLAQGRHHLRGERRVRGRGSTRSAARAHARHGSGGDEDGHSSCGEGGKGH